MNSDNLSPWSKYIQDLIHTAIGKRGQVNIIIAGHTGVGKSTLINTVFEGNLAKTGTGRPVTPEIEEITKEGIPLTLIDTKGLELARYKKTMRDLSKLVKDKQKPQKKIHDRIHIAWVCILEGSTRIEDGHIALVKMLDNNHIPVIVVITKSVSSDKTLINEVWKILQEARDVIPILAEEMQMVGGHVVHPHGLSELLDRTMELIPEDVKDAFSASQRISLEIKQQRAHMIVLTSAIGAGSTGLVPGIDIVGPSSAQILMIIGINAVWGGIHPGVTFLLTLFFGTVTATITASGAWGMLIRWIPILGTLSVAVLAFVFTAVIGEAYITSTSLHK